VDRLEQWWQWGGHSKSAAGGGQKCGTVTLE
jgi:hypothetical protein